MTGQQLTLESAIAAGQHGMAISLESAERRDPSFRPKAENAILRHLAHAPGFQASGEELVLICKALGIVPANGDRAFGAVFRALSTSNRIRCLRSDLPRSRGHGTSGGKLWGLVQ